MDALRFSFLRNIEELFCVARRLNYFGMKRDFGKERELAGHDRNASRVLRILSSPFPEVGLISHVGCES
ncbi:hypothetical protein Q31a_41110 [Aureliella helgolandensis]|uniref:Uncharacterized protein n=1 Tax=Aureliella helgolandensis TaxID=2527968 RepID=A0A518GB21_9BACT|nr:hypothetical protein Q31a_41110 [Aureliella helgolandensis]